MHGLVGRQREREWLFVDRYIERCIDTWIHVDRYIGV